MKAKILATAVMSIMMCSFANATDDFSKIESSLRQVNDGRFKDSNVKVVRKVDLVGANGLYEVTIDGQTLVTTEDGKYGIIGDLFDLENMINLSAEERNKAMVDVVKAEIPKLSDDDMVVFPSTTGETKGSLYVFTDPTCGYCQKLHQEVEQYSSAGIAVKYIPYPRSALEDGQAGYEQTKQIMCADDKLEAMTKIKDGSHGGTFVKESYDDECVAKVAKGKELGMKVGLSGTPFLYLSTGEVIPGYQPVANVISMFSK
jgi:thiol:disulfide interchange protein DsbC